MGWYSGSKTEINSKNKTARRKAATISNGMMTMTGRNKIKKLKFKRIGTSLTSSMPTNGTSKH
jgi:hypothetical protein